MPEWSAEGGLAALFAAAFVSATVLPANSELVLVAFLKLFPDRFGAAIAVATVGNTLGAFTTYGIGRLFPGRGAPRGRALEMVRRYGPAALLLSWVPVIGDAMCAAAGWLRLPLLRCGLALVAGKLGRYLAVAYVAVQ